MHKPIDLQVIVYAHKNFWKDMQETIYLWGVEMSQPTFALYFIPFYMV